MFFFFKRWIFGLNHFDSKRNTLWVRSGCHRPRSESSFLKYFPSLKLTWHIKITLWKRRFLSETIIFRGYVSFRECMCIFSLNPYLRLARQTIQACHSLTWRFLCSLRAFWNFLDEWVWPPISCFFVGDTRYIHMMTDVFYYLLSIKSKLIIKLYINLKKWYIDSLQISLQISAETNRMREFGTPLARNPFDLNLRRKSHLLQHPGDLGSRSYVF